MTRALTRRRKVSLAMLAAIVIGIGMAQGRAGAVGVAPMQIRFTQFIVE